MATRRKPSAARVPEGAKKSLGTPSTKTGAKTSVATNSADGNQVESAWPRAADGYPLAKIEATCSELIPTGDYANVTLGPARLTVFVDPREDGGLDKDLSANIAEVMNDAFHIVEVDVIAVQREFVNDSLANS